MHEWYEQIEQYLNGHMSPEQRRHFESEVAMNDELYALLMVYKQIETDMRESEQHSAEEAALKSTLQKLSAVYFNRAGTGHDTAPAEKPVAGIQGNTAGEDGRAAQQPAAAGAGIKKFNRWKLPAMAAAILGVISLGLFWFFNHQQSNRHVAVNHTNGGAARQEAADTASPGLNAPVTGLATHDSLEPHPLSGNNSRLHDARGRQLFAANFTPDAVPASIPPSLQEPMADYAAARHRDALAGFDAADPGTATRGMEEDNRMVSFYIHYYSAQSLMATSHVAKAIAELQLAMQKIPGRSYGIKVSWYLALAYLHNGDSKKAQHLLQQLAADRTAGQYRRKAADLLKALDI